MLDMRQLLIFSFLFLSCSNFEDDITVTTPNQFQNNFDEDTVSTDNSSEIIQDSNLKLQRTSMMLKLSLV
jgi:hypothetical protein